jgi:hypothetical protein
METELQHSSLTTLLPRVVLSVCSGRKRTGLRAGSGEDMYVYPRPYLKIPAQIEAKQMVNSQYRVSGTRSVTLYNYVRNHTKVTRFAECQAFQAIPPGQGLSWQDLNELLVFTFQVTGIGYIRQDNLAALCYLCLSIRW